MANLKEIRRRIGSVNKTKQITSAMKLVAAAKLRRATANALGARPFQERLGQVLGRVAARAGGQVEHPLLVGRDRIERVLLVVCTSDRGLCGPFNTNLLRQTRGWLVDQMSEGRRVEIHAYGRKGISFLEFQNVPLAARNPDWGGVPKMELVRPLAELMITGWAEDRFDEVWIGYNRFVNTLTQKPCFERILPLCIEATSDPLEYSYEPSAEALLGTMLPLHLRTLLLQAFLETEAGFYAAQMTAMESATRNATELIDSLTLQYNRARQAAITKEITEIVGGAEAL